MSNKIDYSTAPKTGEEVITLPIHDWLKYGLEMVPLHDRHAPFLVNDSEGSSWQPVFVDNQWKRQEFR